MSVSHIKTREKGTHEPDRIFHAVSQDSWQPRLSQRVSKPLAENAQNARTLIIRVGLPVRVKKIAVRRPGAAWRFFLLGKMWWDRA